MKTTLGWVLVAGMVATAGYLVGFRDDRVDYNAQIKPILNKHCIACHGGVKQAGGFSVLFREDALAKTKSGHPAILPGDAAHSEFIKRLTHKDPEERMPLKAEPLRQEEIALLTKWIDQGLPWDTHWAYRRPQRPEVPGKGLFAGVTSWFAGNTAKNDLDFFVENRLDAEGLKLAPEADRTSLIRRVSFDLTGLPPTADQLARYTQAADWNTAYGQMVDSLLASPAFGERWASMWLDLARYADSRGYQKDNARSIWRYRDWVIRSFNADKPFDQFTVEQLAGDLLPNPARPHPTDDQLIATAFHRNTMNNDETGTVDEEFRVAALLDRVSTTWETWQGTSFSCVQCHSHPYDPFRHEEYYKFLAFFNNTRDEDTQDEAPFLREFSPEDQKKLEEVERWLTRVNPQSASQNPQAFDWLRFVRYLEPRHHAHFADRYVSGALAGDRNIALKNGGSCRLSDIRLDGRTQLLVHLDVRQPGGTLQLHLDSPTGPLLGEVRLDTTAKTDGKVLQFWPVKSTAGRHDVYLTAKNLKVDAEPYFFNIDWFQFLPDFPGKNSPDFVVRQRQYVELLAAKTANTPILLPTDPDYRRPTHVFVRGNWLSPGKEVQPDVPHSLPALGTRSRDRLGMAQWLVSPENPLTARVAVNRFWEQLFGVGLVETLEDFGTAGTKPAHPELLDYLAVRFAQDWHWSVKSLLRYVVLSATYRQTSKAEADLLAKDPQNRLLARGPRLRLNAEMIRDQALAVSGLLSRKMYGKPVMPYQPEGIWQAVNSNLTYHQSEGEDQYRRAIYTFARRTGPYPSMVTFDAGSREVCLSRRIRTNTPLQALTLLNDPAFVEAAASLARLSSGQKTVSAQIADIYERAIGRKITPEKEKKLTAFYGVALQKFRQKKGEASPPLSALTIVASAILNTDEFVTKP